MTTPSTTPTPANPTPLAASATEIAANQIDLILAGALDSQQKVLARLNKVLASTKNPDGSAVQAGHIIAARTRFSGLEPYILALQEAVSILSPASAPAHLAPATIKPAGSAPAAPSAQA